MRSPVALCLVALAVPGPTVSAPCVSYEDHLRWLTTTQLPGGGQIYDIEIAGDRAYIATESFYNFHVVDVSRPEAPVAIHRRAVPDELRGLRVAGSLLLLAQGASGLEVYRLPDADSLPVRLGGLRTPGNAEDVAASGDLALVACGESGLAIVDISIPQEPQLRSMFDTPGFAERILVHDGLAMLADRSGGVRIIDFSDPSAPFEVGAVPLPGPGARDISLQGNLAFVAALTSGMYVIDVSDPSAPLIVTLFVPGPLPYMEQIVLHGDKAFLADQNWGLRAVDIREPRSPALLGTLKVSFGYKAVARIGNIIYLGAASGGLVVVDATSTGAPSAIRSFRSASNARDAALVGDHLLIVGRDCLRYGCPGGIDTWDLTDVTSPIQRPWVAVSGRPMRIEVAGDRAYILQTHAASPPELLAFDVSHPGNPVPVGGVPVEPFTCLAVYKSIVYIGSEDGILMVYDATSDSPALVGSVPLPGPASDLAVIGPSERWLLAACGTHGLAAYDLADPLSPILVDVLDTVVDARAVTPHGNAAILVDHGVFHTGRLIAVDAVSSEGIRVLGSREVPRPVAVAARGSHAYVIETANGVQVADIRSPSDPATVGCVSLHEYLVGIAADDDRVVAWSRSGSLPLVFVIPVQCDAGVATATPPPPLPDRHVAVGLQPPSPNPSRDGTVTLRFSAPRGTRLALGIFDVAGRRVRSIAIPDVGEGTNHATWDGRTDLGVPAAPGVYFVHLRTDGGSARGEDTARLTLVR